MSNVIEHREKMGMACKICPQKAQISENFIWKRAGMEKCGGRKELRMTEQEEKIIERLEALEKRLTYQEDRMEIENLMAKHNFYFSAGEGRRIVPQLWTKEENASIEYGASGVYGALWKVKTFYVDYVHPGCFKTFTGTNRYLRIAPDGKSAYGVWMVFGTETDAGDLSGEKLKEDDQRRVLLSSKTAEGEAYRAEVLLQNHEVNFVKEDGQWRIHDLHISEYFRFPAGSDWVRYAKKRQITDGMWLEEKFMTPDPIPAWENLPSGETTRHWQYDVDALPKLQIALEEGNMEKRNVEE